MEENKLKLFYDNFSLITVSENKVPNFSWKMAQTKKQPWDKFSEQYYYQGGKKHETDARSYEVNELELGIEWQPNKNFELVAMYTISERRFEDFKLQNNFQTGNLLRLQAQLNF